MLSDTVLDLFLGSACAGCGAAGRALCHDCRATLPSSAFKAMPTPAPAGLVDVWAATTYDGVMRSLLLAHKERRRLALSRPLGGALGAAVACAPLTTDLLRLVPVPSAPSVVRARGHDPLLRLARVATASLRRRGIAATVDQRLRVVRRPADQSGLTSVERAANLRGVFGVRGSAGGSTGQLVLVDDVVTTGSTLREAQRALESAGKVVSLAVVVAATRRRRPPRGEFT